MKKKKRESELLARIKTLEKEKQWLHKENKRLHRVISDLPGPHTDELLRKHHLLLQIYQHNDALLVDWETEQPVSKERALAYLSDLGQDPRFPSLHVVGQLKAKYLYFNKGEKP